MKKYTLKYRTGWGENISMVLIGEEMYFKSIKYAEKDLVKIRIVGVFTNSEDNDNYWVKSPSAYNNYLFINPAFYG